MKQIDNTNPPVTDRRLIQAASLSSAGFLAAILGNWLIPQISAGVKLADYALGPLRLDMNGFYRIVLLAVMLTFLLGAFGPGWIPGAAPAMCVRPRFDLFWGWHCCYTTFWEQSCNSRPSRFFRAPLRFWSPF